MASMDDIPNAATLAADRRQQRLHAELYQELVDRTAARIRIMGKGSVCALPIEPTDIGPASERLKAELEAKGYKVTPRPRARFREDKVTNFVIEIPGSL